MQLIRVVMQVLLYACFSCLSMHAVVQFTRLVNLHTLFETNELLIEMLLLLGCKSMVEC
jgi:hypothetical protein